MSDREALPYDTAQELVDFAAYQHLIAMFYGENGDVEAARRWDEAAVKNNREAQKLGEKEGLKLPVLPTRRF